MSTCKSCGAPIRWVKTETGKNMPLDPEPCADGNVMVLGGVATVLSPADAVRGRMYKSHFATCPNADTHRKTSKGENPEKG